MTQHKERKIGFFLFLCLIILITTSTVFYTVTSLPDDYPEAFKGKAGGIIFSGQNNSNVVACPWVINSTDDSIIGPNDIFREYLNEDLSLEIQKYPLILGFNFEYTHIMHDYDDFYQGDPYKENSTFDRYYGVVEFDCNSKNESDIRYWDKTIAPQLELTLTNKWYVSRFEFVIVQKKGTVIGYTYVETYLAFLLLSIMTIWISRKK
ncbi:MAG: hypothetical protein ACFFB2_11985 [Promethearchaeota archaeon]